MPKFTSNRGAIYGVHSVVSQPKYIRIFIRQGTPISPPLTSIIIPGLRQERVCIISPSRHVAWISLLLSIPHYTRCASIGCLCNSLRLFHNLLPLASVDPICQLRTCFSWSLPHVWGGRWRGISGTYRLVWMSMATGGLDKGVSRD